MKKILALVAVALLVAGSLAAQAKANSDVKVFALELGTGVNYDIAAKAANATQTFAFDFGLNDAVQAGFVVVKGSNTAANAHNFSLVKLGVYPLTDLNVNVLLGADGTNAIVGGFGLGFNVFRASNNGLTTALNVGTQYLFADPANGNLGMGLTLKIGL